MFLIKRTSTRFDKNSGMAKKHWWPKESIIADPEEDPITEDPKENPIKEKT